MGTPEEQEETMKGLRNANGFLRHELAQRLTLRYMPELNFRLDTSIEEGSRILGLINQVEREDKEKAALAAQAIAAQEAGNEAQ
jgi:ribosome-binding factor A